MARSLRSKKDQANKRAKRATNFGEAHDQRALRLAEKVHGASSDQLKALRKKLEAAHGDEVMDESEDEVKEDQFVKKISTAGWSSKKKHQSKRKHNKKKGKK